MWKWLRVWLTWSSALLALVIAAHLLMSVRMFPTPASIIDPDTPILTVDHALHLYHGALGARFLREAGTTWGFDPFFMAGYPETPVWDSSSNLAIVSQVLAGGGPSARAYKLAVFGCAALIVPILLVAAAALRLPRAETAIAGMLAWFYFWCGFPYGLYLSGLFSFLTAGAMVGLLLALAARFVERPGWRIGLILTLVGGLTLLAHVTAPVMAAGGLVAVLIAAGRHAQPRWRVLGLVIAGSLAVAGNLIWLAPMWRFRGLRTGTGFFMTGSPLAVVELYLSDLFDGRLSLTLLIGGLVGLVLWWRRSEGRAAGIWAGSIAVLIALIFLGSQWHPTRVMEPMRFRAPLGLLLTLPAASTLAAIGRLAARTARAGSIWARLAGLAILAGLIFGATQTPRTWLNLRFMLTRPPRLVVGLRPEMRSLVRALSAETDNSARILFEDQLRLLEATEPESTHWTPLLPSLLGPRPPAFLGGLYHGAFIQHYEGTSFGDFTLAGKHLLDWTPAELDGFLTRYNAGWVVCWSPIARYVFDHVPTARRIAALPRWHTPGRVVPAAEEQWRRLVPLAGPETALRYVREGASQYTLYRLDRSPTFALTGRARLASADYNRLTFEDLEPGPDGSIVLSLHWLDTWRTQPPSPLEQVPVPGDPVGFVRIRPPGPIPRLEIYNGYRDRFATD